MSRSIFFFLLILFCCCFFDFFVFSLNDDPVPLEPFQTTLITHTPGGVLTGEASSFWMDANAKVFTFVQDSQVYISPNILPSTSSLGFDENLQRDLWNVQPDPPPQFNFNFSLVSFGFPQGSEANRDAINPMISASGNAIVFQTQASNVDDQFSGFTSIFVHNISISQGDLSLSDR